MKHWQTATEWWKAHPFTVDAAFALLLFVVLVLDVAFSSREGSERDPNVFSYLLLAGQSLPLAARRRNPIAVMYAVGASFGLYWVIEFPLGFGAAAAVGIYSAAANGTDRRRTWSRIATMVVVMTGFAFTRYTPGDTSDAVLQALVFGWAHIVPALLGEVVYQRGRRIFELQERAERAEETLETNARLAVVEERNRIAREMHDVVAHGMSVIAVQAAAAQEIAHTNPEKTVEVLARIEHAGRESLTEMRRMLAVLRADEDQQASLAPQPSLSDVPHAVAQSNESGVPTQLVIAGEQRTLPPGIELTAFRIVQEALTNVRRHAGQSASAVVRVSYEPSTVTIEVTDDGRGAVSSFSDSGGGNGLVGMRERIEIYDGSFAAGPVSGGGYAVRAVLPVNADDARPSVASALQTADEVPL